EFDEAAAMLSLAADCACMGARGSASTLVAMRTCSRSFMPRLGVGDDAGTQLCVFWFDRSGTGTQGNSRSRVWRVQLKLTRIPRMAGQCEEGDSNPHGVNRQLLRLVRLPISPSSRDAERKISGRDTITHPGRCPMVMTWLLAQADVHHSVLRATAAVRSRDVEADVVAGFHGVENALKIGDRVDLLPRCRVQHLGDHHARLQLAV